jgi:hypothetical protein
MQTPSFLILVLPVLGLACSGSGDDDTGARGGASSSNAGANASGGSAGSMAGAAGASGAPAQSGDATLIVPAELTVMPVEGGNGGLDVVALTLRNGANGPELYAALKNDGDALACSAGFSPELLDGDQQSMGSWINGLLTQHIYRLDSGDLAGCVAPGDLAMVAITDLPADLDIHKARYVRYLCNYFASMGTPVGGFTVTPTGTQSGAAGTVYTGTFVNDIGSPVDSPSVTAFPVNRAGRPLGVATATGTAADVIPAGGSWNFTTSGVDTRGVDVVMYGSASLEP